MKRTYGGVKRYHGPMNVAAQSEPRSKTVNARAWFFAHDFQKTPLPSFKGAIVSRCIQTAESSNQGNDER
jgi:hypothetical protein